MMNTPRHDIFNDFLDALGVPHTSGYSAERFDSMPFPTLFGLKKLLEEYGVATAAFRVADKEADLKHVTIPFIAPVEDGLVIVTHVDDDTVSYLSQGQLEKMDRGDWVAVWDGMAMCASTTPSTREPDYKSHRRLELLKKWRNVGIVAGLVLLLLYFFIAGGLWQKPALWFTVALDCAGLYFSWLLVRKSLGYTDSHAEAVCRVLQEGGCDEILSTDASKIFGLFGWAEVGLTYFSVSLVALLLFPGVAPTLALFNLCCLPYTFWSIWYQRFRAHHWCTLCVSVQATLWCLFFSYLAGGFVGAILPLSIAIIPLGLTYLTVLLALNRLLPAFRNSQS